MRQPKAYQHEIVIPIVLKIPIYVEPVVIDTSSSNIPYAESSSATPPPQASSSVNQNLVLHTSHIVKLNAQIQPNAIGQELALTHPYQPMHLSKATVQKSLNPSLDKALYVLRGSEISLCPRPIWLLAIASISAVLMQVFLASSQPCPALSHNSLLQAGAQTGEVSLLCSAPDDENMTKIKPVS